MGKLTRGWPFACLIAFVLILTFHTTPPLMRPVVSGIRPAPQEDNSPEMADPAVKPGPTSPRTTEAAAPVEEQAPQRTPVLAGLLWAIRNQNDDGSWGDVPTTLGGRSVGKAGVTGLVLLSLLGAGYNQLSKDEYDDIAVGPCVKKALQWLIAEQREDGVFRSGYDTPFDQALASLAVSEAYGMTASQSLKEPASRALDALVRLQGADGSWGGSESTTWAVQALVSGDLNELPYPRETRDRALEYLRSHPDVGQLEARQVLRDRSDPEAMEALAQSLMRSLPRPGETTFEDILHASTGIYLYDGSEGMLWKKWAEPMRESLVPFQNRDGSWNGGTLSHRLVRTSLAELSLQTFYRFSNNYTFGR
jgi:hypothetical protein